MDWVEILEPESQRKLYANVVTGDCRWSPLPGVQFKPTHANQWWELFDPKQNRSYYYNVSSQVTSWERPTSSTADIIALSKLQFMQEQMQQQQPQKQQPQPQQSQPQPQPQQQQPQPQPQQPQPQPVAQSQPQPAQQHAAPQATPAQNGGTAKKFEATDAPPAPGPAPDLLQKRAAELKKASSNSELQEYKDNITTVKRGIFRRKVSIATILSWSKDALSKPMLTTHPKKQRPEAVNIFKMVQQYMGDRPVKGREPTTIALEIVSKCWSEPCLRDEVFIQLCKQTTDNRSTTSCELGWELIVICLNFFPPSAKFFSYLEGYIARHCSGMPAAKQGEVPTFADVAFRQLERVRQTGAKRGQQEPTRDEVEQARTAIFNPSVFGSTLEDIMEIQAEKKPGLRIPWVLKVLSKAVIDLQGGQTEGIFRVPGDIDAVNALKVQVDRWEEPKSLPDPHIPASALKLWFRELYSPLFPANIYDECISASDSCERSLSCVEKLSPLHRTVLLFIIRFLQIIGHPENQGLTKMTHDNLAMVWAPNFLRCPSEDPMIIFQNTKREMTFVRHLVVSLDTSDVADLFD